MDILYNNAIVQRSDQDIPLIHLLSSDFFAEKNAVLFVFLFKEITLWPEVASPPCLRITNIIVTNIELDFVNYII